MSLLDPKAVREVAARLGLRPTKQRGQNFVVDANTVRKIVKAARVDAGDEVLEVGPGLGSLTLGLLEAGARVTAVELDGRLGHTGMGRFRDMWRDNRTLLAGQPTLRYGTGDVAGAACEVAVQVAAVLSRLGWTGLPTRCRNCFRVPEQSA